MKFENYIKETGSFKKPKYIVAYSFGQGIDPKTTVIVFVKTDKSEKWGKSKAIELVVKHPKVPMNKQVETKVLKNFDDMADNWYDKYEPIIGSQNMVFFGLKQNQFI